jgi:hypothetical protein
LLPTTWRPICMAFSVLPPIWIEPKRLIDATERRVV